MYDFQYSGLGPGIKDVAYFLGSIFNSEQLFAHEQRCLDYYFQQLQQAIVHYNKPVDSQKLIKQWTERYDWACVDFLRFLNGWCPDHKKVNAYLLSKRQTVLQDIQS